MKILVLGLGNVGSLICKELYANNHVIFAADMSRKNCDKLLKSNKSITKNEVVCTDINDYSAEILIRQFEPDLVINALPGSVGFKVSKAVLENDCNLIDISFSDEDCFKLKDLADKKGLFAAFDCGIAPGFMNMVLGHAEKNHDVDSFTCYVGGLPKNKKTGYKATFNIFDLLEEYIRPARYKLYGDVKEVDPLSFRDIGTFGIYNNEFVHLEAFLSDGLRTALRNRKTKNIKELTLRYPGHIDSMKVLKKMGFLEKHPDSSMSPLNLTAEILKNRWTFKPNEKDMTIMEILFSVPSKKETHIMDLFDVQTKNNESSMARTTGYSCCAVLKAFAEGKLEKRFYTPEEIGESCYQFIEDELKSKGINIKWSKRNY